MPRNRTAWLALVALFLLLAGAAREASAQEKPSDSASKEEFFRANDEVAASQILATWATKFDALLVQDPQVASVRIKFLTNTKTEMTWGAIKQILDFYDVVVVESQPTAGGPWLIRAHHRRSISQKEGPPWRYVEGDEVPEHDEIVTAVFQIKNGAANSIFATVRGLQTRDTNRIGNILYVPGPEVLIIVDLASKVRYYGRVIEALDVEGPRQRMEIYQINYAPVQDLASVLTNVIATLGGATGQQQGGGPVVVNQPGRPGGASQVLADARTNQLIVAAFPSDFTLIERVINALDVRVAPPTGRFHVYKCKDADAEDLAAKIQELFTGVAPATRSSSSTTQQPNRPGMTPRPTATAGAAVLSEATGVNEVETRIVADERTNSLLIQAEDRAYREILTVLEQLDRKRRRVMIEAEVWEIATPSDSMTIGFELAALTNAHEDSNRPSAATSFGLSQLDIETDADGNPTRLSRLPSLAGGITAVLTRDTFDKIPILMTAVANFSESRLVTKPFAITNDNTPATFTLADRQPFLTTTVNNVASQQNVQFVDANSTLTIEPQVNSEENLTLKLTLEISTFGARPSSDLPPATNTRKYEGEVTVANNHYVVFGGLERETESFTESKVPFLGDIPILGHLFKNWTRDRSKTKLYIFIRPTIFADEGFGAEKRLASAMRERAHVESAREDWLPPIVPDRYLKGAGYTLQDEAFDVFGSGSANPFSAGASVPLGDE